jgi:thiol-disulfide isomerase/thioredoxin
MPLHLQLFSRPGCHLCDEMKAVVQPLARELGAVVEEINIAGDPALESEYGLQIPVLLINGRKAFKYRLTERELRARLRREGDRSVR